MKGENITVLSADYKDCIKSLSKTEKCGIVYIDPPFKQHLQVPAISLLAESGALADGALIITESQKGDGALCGAEEISGISLRKQYNYSKIQVTVFTYSK